MWPPTRVSVALGVVAAIVLLRGILPASDCPWLPGGVLALSLGLGGLGFAWRQRAASGGAGWREDPSTGVLVAAFAVLFGTFLAHDYRLTSDGVDHFVYLRSLWIDGDLDFANDYAQVSPRGASVDPLTPLGRVGNLHPVGPALLWSPFYLAADALARLSGRAPDGQGPLYRNAAALGGLVYGWIGLVLLYRAVRLVAERWAALVASLGIGFGTFLYWYVAFAPTMAHAVAFCAAALFVWVWLSEPAGARRALLLGAALGLCALTRWANALLVLLPAVEALPRLARREEWRPLAREALLGLLAFLAVFWPQMLVWRLLYGAWLTVPQGAAFVGASPHWDGVLFSPHHGLFSWSPLAYLALPGFLMLARRAPWRGLAALACGLALVRLNAGVADWWGGAAFGARRFDALLPLLGLGLGATLVALARFSARHPRLLAGGCVGLLVGWNLLLARSYESGAWDYAGPVAFEQMGQAALGQVDRALGAPFSLPGALFEWARSGRVPADYEALYMQRPYSRWSVRMGLDERLFLEDGWSPLARLDGQPARQIAGEGAGLVLPLHRAREYRFGARLRVSGEGPARLRLLVNQRVAGSLEAGPAWADAELLVPASFWRAGRNQVRLRRLDGGVVAIAGLWLEPTAAP